MSQGQDQESVMLLVLELGKQQTKAYSVTGSNVNGKLEGYRAIGGGLQEHR